jgi:hypothetical protein
VIPAKSGAVAPVHRPLCVVATTSFAGDDEHGDLGAALETLKAEIARQPAARP